MFVFWSGRDAAAWYNKFCLRRQLVKYWTIWNDRRASNDILTLSYHSLLQGLVLTQISIFLYEILWIKQDKKSSFCGLYQICIIAHIFIFCNRAVKGLDVIVKPVRYLLIYHSNKGIRRAFLLCKHIVKILNRCP